MKAVIDATPIIKTERLILRPWRESDFLPYSQINSDKKVMEFIPGTISREESDDMVRSYQEEWKQRNHGRWAVEAPGIADFIGYVGLHYTDFKANFTPCIEIGWRLGSEFWGKGFATEAAVAALDYGFNTLKLKDFYAFTFEGNENSRKLMERLGMTREPSLDFDHPALPPGHPIGRYVVYKINSFEAIPKRKIK